MPPNRTSRCRAEPLMFIKPSTAVIGPGDADRAAGGHRPRRSRGRGRRGDRRGARRHVPEADAHRLRLRHHLRQRRHGARAAEEGRRSTRAPRGSTRSRRSGRASRPGSTTRRRRAAVEGWVNGERRQASSTAQLIFPIDQLIAFISSVMTLLPGDIISTGTPSGIGPLKAGDRSRSRSKGSAS